MLEERNRGHWSGNRETPRKRTTNLWARKRMNPGTETEQQGKRRMYLEGPRRMAVEAEENRKRRATAKLEQRRATAKLELRRG